MVLTTTQTTTIITTPHPISFPTSLQSLAGLKRKGNSACPIKSKMKRADSASSLNAEGQGRDSSDSDYRLRTEIDKKRKAKSDRTNSPTSRSVTEAEMEPYLNSYPIQMSNGSSYPQNNIVAEGNAPADWFNLGQPQTAETTQGLVQRYHQSTANPTYNTAPLFSGTEPTQTGYTHGMDCNTNTAMYYQSQSYPTTMPQNSISHSIQQMDFPDPFGIGGGDLNGLDLCWLVDDMDLPDSAADVYNNRVPAFERERERYRTSHPPVPHPLLYPVHQYCKRSTPATAFIAERRLLHSALMRHTHLTRTPLSPLAPAVTMDASMSSMLLPRLIRACVTQWPL